MSFLIGSKELSILLQEKLELEKPLLDSEPGCPKYKKSVEEWLKEERETALCDRSFLLLQNNYSEACAVPARCPLGALHPQKKHRKKAASDI